MHRALIIGVLCALGGGEGTAQQPSAPAFEAASIKPTVNAPTPNWRSRFQPTSYTASNIPVRELIKIAYEVRVDAQVQGGPDWIDSARFDVQASSASQATPAEMRIMLRGVLANRFKLRARPEQQELPVYALVKARSDGRLGTALKPIGEKDCAPAATPPTSGQRPCGSVAFSADSMMVSGVSMARLAELLPGTNGFTGIDRLVIDRTSLSGLYAFDVKFLQPTLPGLRQSDSPDLAAFPTALQEQLGLKLEPTRAQVEVLVIESVERPTPD